MTAWPLSRKLQAAAAKLGAERAEVLRKVPKDPKRSKKAMTTTKQVARGACTIVLAPKIAGP